MRVIMIDDYATNYCDCHISATAAGGVCAHHQALVGGCRAGLAGNGAALFWQCASACHTPGVEIGDVDLCHYDCGGTPTLSAARRTRRTQHRQPLCGAFCHSGDAVGHHDGAELRAIGHDSGRHGGRHGI